MCDFLFKIMISFSSNFCDILDQLDFNKAVNILQSYSVSHFNIYTILFLDIDQSPPNNDRNRGQRRHYSKVNDMNEI